MQVSILIVFQKINVDMCGCLNGLEVSACDWVVSISVVYFEPCMEGSHRAKISKLHPVRLYLIVHISFYFIGVHDKNCPWSWGQFP